MAIAVVARSTGATGTGATVTWSHTVTGADRILVVGVSCTGAAAGAVTGVTFGAAALTQFATILAPSTNGSGNIEIRTYLFYLLAPATGTDTITVSCTYTGSGRAQCGSVSFTGVHQTTPWNSAGPHTQSTFNAQPSVTVTSAADEWGIACFSSVTTPDPTPVAAGGETIISEQWTGSPIFVQHTFADEDSSGASTTLSFTGITLDPTWHVTGVGGSLMPAGDGGGSPLVINKPRFADLTLNVHKKNRTIGLRGGLSTALRPEGAAAAASKAVKPHAKTQSRLELVKKIKKGRPIGLAQLAAPINGGVVSGSNLALEFRYSMPWLR